MTDNIFLSLARTACTHADAARDAAPGRDRDMAAAKSAAYLDALVALLEVASGGEPETVAVELTPEPYLPGQTVPAEPMVLFGPRVPVGTVLRDREGDYWTRLPDGYVLTVRGIPSYMEAEAQESYRYGERDWHNLAQYAPLSVERLGGDE